MLHNADQAVDVVSVKVRNDQQWHSANPEPVQATAHCCRCGATIHDDGTLAARPNCKAVTLTHIARDQQPITGRPARLSWSAAQADDHDDSEQQREPRSRQDVCHGDGEQQ